MRNFTGRLEGDLDVTENINFCGLLKGSATVKSGVAVVLNGMITENLTLEDASSVQLNGMVVGSVFNKGGHLIVRGTVQGSVVTTAGDTTVDDGAVVLGSLADMRS